MASRPCLGERPNLPFMCDQVCSTSCTLGARLHYILESGSFCLHPALHPAATALHPSLATPCSVPDPHVVLSSSAGYWRSAVHFGILDATCKARPRPFGSWFDRCRNPGPQDGTGCRNPGPTGRHASSCPQAGCSRPVWPLPPRLWKGWPSERSTRPADIDRPLPILHYSPTWLCQVGCL